MQDVEDPEAVAVGESKSVAGMDMTLRRDPWFRVIFHAQKDHMWWVPILLDNKWMVVSSQIYLSMRHFF